MQGYRVAVCQMAIDRDKEKNIARAREMIARAAEKGARLVVLPEMFNCPYVARLFPRYAESYPEGPSLQMLSRAAREEGVYLVGGSLPERDGDRVYNTSFIFAPDGRLLGKHRKVHLFDVELAGGLSVKESSTLGAGNRVTVIPAELGGLGVAICYDIRFPELMRLMVLKGARVVVIPAAFNMTTGPAHWELVFRMRAVDNQAYFIGASPARDPGAPYVAYGHSLVVDPWGKVVSMAGEGEEIIYAEIDPGLVDKVRSELPLLRHRRTDVYALELLVP
ncbi:carbon-nitrogen hydrolase family protein [Desulfofundulus thermocisternus]|uniref:carbon-nitrogen hydrolase family protein n=1 Tax=Desulfofundulus thermocisternus TaxID=42471 RepID=UPI001A0D22D3|nr:carbon-nitrogen hydrolase family protein [Desulfofundulus thermocisternus]MBE3586590.1 carbon-nitrogen hydrolase family protein [Thermoanaerobacter sp.]MCS5695677.1 carbon-nitrogen hydrolase family protein [Desulfofundulus thermocisternus]